MANSAVWAFLERRLILVENLAGFSPDDFRGAPAEGFLGPLVPVDDAIFEVLYVDRVIGDVEERGLFAHLGIRLPALHLRRGPRGEDLQRGSDELHMLQRLSEKDA